MESRFILDWLPEVLIGHITSISPSHSLAGLDRIAWMGTSSRYLSIRSVYRKMNERSWNLRGRLGNFLGRLCDLKGFGSSLGWLSNKGCLLRQNG